MSKVFKILVSISIWVLFIGSLVSIIGSMIWSAINPGAEAYNFSDVAWEAVSVLALFLSVVAVKIRKSLD